MYTHTHTTNLDDGGFFSIWEIFCSTGHNLSGASCVMSTGDLADAGADAGADGGEEGTGERDDRQSSAFDKGGFRGIVQQLLPAMQHNAQGPMGLGKRHVVRRCGGSWMLRVDMG
jgi:hypothetical protein